MNLKETIREAITRVFEDLGISAQELGYTDEELLEYLSTEIYDSVSERLDEEEEEYTEDSEYSDEF